MIARRAVPAVPAVRDAARRNAVPRTIAPDAVPVPVAGTLCPGIHGKHHLARALAARSAEVIAAT